MVSDEYYTVGASNFPATASAFRYCEKLYYCSFSRIYRSGFVLDKFNTREGILVFFA